MTGFGAHSTVTVMSGKIVPEIANMVFLTPTQP